MYIEQIKEQLTDNGYKFEVDTVDKYIYLKLHTEHWSGAARILAHFGYKITFLMVSDVTYIHAEFISCTT